RRRAGSADGYHLLEGVDRARLVTRVGVAGGARANQVRGAGDVVGARSTLRPAPQGPPSGRVVRVGGGHRDVKVDWRIGVDQLIDEALKVVCQALLFWAHRAGGVDDPKDVHLPHRHLLVQVTLVRNADAKVSGVPRGIFEHAGRRGVDLRLSRHHRVRLDD